MISLQRTIALLIGTVALTIVFTPLAKATNPSYSHKLPIDTVPFYPDGTYDEGVPRPDDNLANPVGAWPVRYHELIPYLEKVASYSKCVRLETYGQSHEGRDLFNVIISSPDNLANLEQFRRRVGMLADPYREKTGFDLDSLIDGLPAFAWMGYTVHGDELSGTDAAVQLIYQLAAGTDSVTWHILDNTIAIIDPLQNPDGRERFLSMLETFQSSVPNYDRQAMQHDGVWPWGRTNHYLFDLNRDWILATQPETRGRLQTFLKWHPQLAIDGHEMGPNATFLFDPPREPINYNTCENVRKWWKVFSDDHATAFDRHGWPYYIEEWHDQWYPGYGSAWSTFSGTIGLLYEQAGVDGVMIKQRDDYCLTYHEAVNHQFSASLANLTTLADNRDRILRDYYQARKKIVDDGRKSGLKFLFVPDGDELKMQQFIGSLLSQGIEVLQAGDEFKVSEAVDIYSEKHHSKKFPAGTFVVSTAQPMGALAKAILEFDPRLDGDFLKEERRELEKHGDTRMYEMSTWSLPLAYDIDAYRTTTDLSVTTSQVTQPFEEALIGYDTTGYLDNPEARFGFVIDMVGEKTHRLLVRLFAEELVIYAAQKPFAIEDRKFRAGALFLRRRGNPENLAETLSGLADEIQISICGVNTGRTTEGSYLGAPSFRLLPQPRVAILTGDGLNYLSVGSLWFTIDKELGIPHSLILLSRLSQTDLSKYNVLIVPSAWGDGLARQPGKQGASKLDKWVSDGGTLICTGMATMWAADTATGLSQARQKRQVLGQLDNYSIALERELHAEAPEVDTTALWHPEEVPPTEGKDDKSVTPPKGGKQAEELDEWQRRFHPRGVIMRANIDCEDWLAFGMKGKLPVMVYSRHALMAAPPVRTTARFATDRNSLRLSGLLWPEARSRWTATAYATHESKGKGQIVLFATDPNVRAYWWGTRKMFANAVLYGPGMGSRFEPYNGH